MGAREGEERRTIGVEGSDRRVRESVYGLRVDHFLQAGGHALPLVALKVITSALNWMRAVTGSPVESAQKPALNRL